MKGCRECNDTREVTRYVSHGYDQPLSRVKVVCPLCTALPPIAPRDYGPQRPFFIVPPKEKQ